LQAGGVEWLRAGRECSVSAQVVIYSEKKIKKTIRSCDGRRENKFFCGQNQSLSYHG
jgi:hypothetical protein